MSEQHLHDAQISPVVQQMGRESVSQCVWRHLLADAGFLCVTLYDVPESLPRHSITATRREYIVRLAFEQDFHAWTLDELAQPLLGLFTERDQAFAVAQRNSAREQTRLAVARELSSAAVANLDDDPQRSMLLALEAAAATEPDGFVIWEGFPLQPGYELTDKIIDWILTVGRKLRAKDKASAGNQNAPKAESH